MRITSIVLAILVGCGEGPQQKPGDPPGGTETPTVTVTPPVSPPTVPDGPATCDAGTEAFVQRIFPLLLGRHAHGAAEVSMWTTVTDELGREAVVRAMTRDIQYQKWWRVQLSDLLEASRIGVDEDYQCFETPRVGVHDGSLTEFIRTNAPDAAAFDENFGMADVVWDALVADDLSVAWQANIFVRANHVAVCAAVEDPIQIETERRATLADGFLSSFIARDVVCMDCHNSEWSTTDDIDPALDRTWGVDALFEQALFSYSGGPPDVNELYAMFRYDGVVYDAYYGGGYGFGPWGIDEDCASLLRDPPSNDFLGQDAAFFGQAYGAQGSVWDIERMFRSGVDALAAAPLEIAADRTVAPDQALAWLSAQHVVDQVWALAYGSPLTIPYGFSRNQAQHERLEALTAAFVASGWSLSELLVAITADPYFNTGLPGTCGAADYGLDPIVDPYSTDDPNVALQGNGPGDLVHRFPARGLLSSASDALEVPPYAEYYTYGDTVRGSPGPVDLQRALGVYLSSSEPGFNGVDFQGMLAWEDRFGLCTAPEEETDFVRRAYEEAVARDVTVEDLVLAVRDRIVADGSWADETERGLVETLVGVSLDTRMSDVSRSSDLDRKVGLFCGTLTLSPEFFTTVEPRPIGPLPVLDLSSEADYAWLEAVLAP